MSPLTQGLNYRSDCDFRKYNDIESIRYNIENYSKIWYFRYFDILENMNAA